MTDIILNDEDFDNFVKEILENHIDDNENLRDLLDRPNRWGNDNGQLSGEWIVGTEKDKPL